VTTLADVQCCLQTRFGAILRGANHAACFVAEGKAEGGTQSLISKAKYDAVMKELTRKELENKEPREELEAVKLE